MKTMTGIITMRGTRMTRMGKFLAMLALLAVPAGAASAHGGPGHHHGHHHRHDAGHKHAWRITAEEPRQDFEVKINAIWCGPATAAAAPKWCGA